MKKYISIIAVLALLTAGFSLAHASGTVAPARLAGASDILDRGVLTSRVVSTVDGDQIEISTWTAKDGTVTHTSRDITKAIYTLEITDLNARIAQMQAEVATDTTNEAQLTY